MCCVLWVGVVCVCCSCFIVCWNGYWLDVWGVVCCWVWDGLVGWLVWLCVCGLWFCVVMICWFGWFCVGVVCCNGICWFSIVCCCRRNCIFLDDWVWVVWFVVDCCVYGRMVLCSGVVYWCCCWSVCSWVLVVLWDCSYVWYWLVFLVCWGCFWLWVVWMVGCCVVMWVVLVWLCWGVWVVVGDGVWCWSCLLCVGELCRVWCFFMCVCVRMYCVMWMCVDWWFCWGCWVFWVVSVMWDWELIWYCWVDSGNVYLCCSWWRFWISLGWCLLLVWVLGCSWYWVWVGCGCCLVFICGNVCVVLGWVCCRVVC